MASAVFARGSSALRSLHTRQGAHAGKDNSARASAACMCPEGPRGDNCPGGGHARRRLSRTSYVHSTLPYNNNQAGAAIGWSMAVATLTEWLATALAEPPQENSLVRSQAHHATVLRTLDSAGMRVCVECLIGKQKKPILFKVTELSSIPYRAPPGAPKWRRTRTPHP